jgi:RNA polymerase sigma factor (sigma-70 family)
MDMDIKIIAGNKERLLIEGIRSRDEKVIAEIYETYFPPVKSFICKNKGNTDDARDVFNDAIVILFLKIRNNSLSLNCSLNTYVYAICRNLWLKKLKSMKPEMISLEDVDEAKHETEVIGEEFLNLNRANLLYQKYLLRMKPVCQKLIIFFLEGKSFSEIARELGLSSGSYARKRKYRCVKVLIKKIRSDPEYRTIHHHE